MVSRTILALSLASSVLSQDVPAPFGYTSGWWGNLPAPQVACHLDTEDTATWVNSGAAQLVDTWIRIHGEDNWLVELQKNITSEHLNPNFLDCTKLGASTCGPPEKDCFSYNPPAHYFVRIAASKANDFFDEANTAVIEMTIENMLKMDDLVKDFGPQINAAMDKEFRIASASMSVAEKVLKNIPVIGSLGGDFIGLMSASTALIGLTTGPSVIDLAKVKEDITNQLHDIFVQTGKNIDLMNQKMLNGQGPMDLNMVMDILKSMRGQTFSDGDASPIAKIMEGGTFLVKGTPKTAEGGILEGMGTVKRSIIGTLLRGTGYFIYTSTNLNQETCGQKGYGFQYIDGKCFGMYLQEKGGLYRGAQDVIDKMQTYGINMVDFYKNVVDCNNGEIGDENVGNGNGYQKCFFNLRTFGDTFESPCDSEGWRQFPELRLTDFICRPPHIPDPVPCHNRCIRGQGWYGDEDEVEAQGNYEVLGNSEVLKRKEDKVEAQGGNYEVLGNSEVLKRKEDEVEAQGGNYEVLGNSEVLKRD